MKKILFLLMLAAITASAGVKNATTLCIEDKTGGVLKFYLSERPKIMFKGNYTIVQTSEIKLLQFRNLARAYFTDEEDPTAVDAAAAGQETIEARANTINIEGFKPLTTVLVYTAAGTLLKKAQADVLGSAKVSVGELPSGVYVVKAGKTTFKMKR